MRKYLAAFALLLFLLAVFTPFASSSPDGIESVAKTFGIQTQQPVWDGIMPNYSVGPVANPYTSTLLAGASGILLVLFAAFLLGTAITRKPPEVKDRQ